MLKTSFCLNSIENPSKAHKKQLTILITNNIVYLHLFIKNIVPINQMQCRSIFVQALSFQASMLKLEKTLIYSSFLKSKVSRNYMLLQMNDVQIQAFLNSQHVLKITAITMEELFILVHFISQNKMNQISSYIKEQILFIFLQSLNFFEEITTYYQQADF
ncbi:hypothetical protein TTHERM_001080488 (macronuclear) [Tetrahymena thermophila SB210]|uniref:Uncharacterized protein n=1 Tax=Tetrahymena thermophila (strain SB210) TaxID=312017 RepID=W7WYQ2_TETTS|nr:hypothetical protein TTHERM_001080488 [Tetrahymena thermophila SB210]EWS72020.1 hypothetical protein TTHERM_001080488 [Tetrahymena thermophila SB210]|eukprot:XP_012655450.1 hypothetical protein TTHERM_001080488 [Tetrahymena thermophila SB210]